MAARACAKVTDSQRQSIAANPRVGSAYAAGLRSCATGPPEDLRARASCLARRCVTFPGGRLAQVAPTVRRPPGQRALRQLPPAPPPNAAAIARKSQTPRRLVAPLSSRSGCRKSGLGGRGWLAQPQHAGKLPTLRARKPFRRTQDHVAATLAPLLPVAMQTAGQTVDPGRCCRGGRRGPPTLQRNGERARRASRAQPGRTGQAPQRRGAALACGQHRVQHRRREVGRARSRTATGGVPRAGHNSAAPVAGRAARWPAMNDGAAPGCGLVAADEASAPRPLVITPGSVQPGKTIGGRS